MLSSYLKRGLAAGAVGGLIYGLFVALIGNNLIRYAETFEHGHEEALTAVIAPQAMSVMAGVVWGLLLGVIVFGLLYYFLEPVIPGDEETSILLLGGAGYLTLSIGPWLVLPPQPPGLEQALDTQTRIWLYVGMMVASVLACGFATALYHQLREYGQSVAAGGAVISFALLAIPVLFAPANPTTGPVPQRFIVTYQWVTVFGQFTLWLVMSTGYVLIRRRIGQPVPVPEEPSSSSGPSTHEPTD